MAQTIAYDYLSSKQSKRTDSFISNNAQATIALRSVKHYPLVAKSTL